MRGFLSVTVVGVEGTRFPAIIKDESHTTSG
jgi:hypothetical protein